MGIEPSFESLQSITSQLILTRMSINNDTAPKFMRSTNFLFYVDGDFLFGGGGTISSTTRPVGNSLIDKITFVDGLS